MDDFKFEKNVGLDAILVHAAMNDLFVPAAIGAGLTASEAFARAEWLKHQPESYIKKVVAKVQDIEGS